MSNDFVINVTRFHLKCTNFGSTYFEQLHFNLEFLN